MNETFTIGEISQLLNVPTATLRFWEEQGLFSVAKSANRYRRYTLRNLVQIADIMFYHNLGIPIKDTREMENFTLDQRHEKLQEVRERLCRKMEEHQRMYRRTIDQIDRLLELQQLMDAEYQPEEVPFRAVAPFDFREKDKLIRYTQDPTLYVRWFDTRNMDSECRGIIVPSDTDEPLLWRYHSSSSFITFLIKEQVNRNYESNVLEKLEIAQKHYKTGVLLAEYLTTCSENGERIDYLKAYLEVLP